MTEISLDDEIQKDRQKQKMDRAKDRLLHQNKQHHQPPHPRSFHDNRKFNDRRFDDRKRRGFNDQRDFRRRPIHKDFHERPRYQNNREREDTPEERPRKVEKKQEGEKQFRTLKVIGLSPEITNEDLYKLFASEGALEKCLIEQDNFGRTLNSALVKYHSPENARNAMSSFNRHKIMNCVLTVEPYRNVKT